ncbi:Proteasome subunit beta type-7 [Tupaia chinensis]|uniref:Proteasome subunit beta type-7 n=1 Tax=Tupaia chinensis TaxID=246437 RepID=L9KNK0_TUPCH|nr:Proteasome subunit beta type-7 [Tupaia chinensis]
MVAVSVFAPPVGGFSFYNCSRNGVNLEADFAKKGHKLPKAQKTGMTIAGVVYKDDIVLGADTRATEGIVVADKNCSKIHFISPNIYCYGAGTAADTDMTTQLISSNLELHSLFTGRLPRVVTAKRMLKQMLFRYQGYIGAALVLGGVDVTGSHLYSIYPHRATDKLPYVTMGSGSLATMAMFEDKFRSDIEREEARNCKSKLDFLRPYLVPNKKGTRFGWYKCEKGTTVVLTKKVTSLEFEQPSFCSAQDCFGGFAASAQQLTCVSQTARKDIRVLRGVEAFDLNKAPVVETVVSQRRERQRIK